MAVVDDFHGAIVRNHDALEAPFVFQDIFQEHRITAGGDAVHRVVGTHDAAGSPFLHTGAEGFQIYFPQFPPGSDGGEGIVSSLSVIVYKMFGGGHHAALFQGLHVCHAHAGIQQHVFPVTLLAAAPALVPGDVDYRRIDLPYSHGAKFPGHRLSFAVIEVVVKGGRHGYALRKTGGISPLGSVQGLSVLQHRNAPPAGFHGPSGVFIYALRYRSGVVRQATVRQEVAHVADMAFRIVALLIELVHKQQLGADLGHFFLVRHPLHEVFHPFLHREFRIPVRKVAPGRFHLVIKLDHMLSGTQRAADKGPGDAHIGPGAFRHLHFQRTGPGIIGKRNRSLHGGEREAALVKDMLVQLDGEGFPARFHGHHTEHPGGENRQRTAAPGMVHAAAVPVSVHAHVPVFEEGVMEGMVHHKVVTAAFTLQGIVSMADGEQGLHHVFLHIGAGVLFGLQHLEKGIVLIRGSHSSQDGQGIHAVVGFPFVFRVTVAAARPGNAVDSLPQRRHLPPDGRTFPFFAHQIGHVGEALQGQHIPQVLQQAQIPVVPPVSPVPVSLVPFHHAVGPQVIGGQVFLDNGKGVAHGFHVAGIHVIRPDAVAPHGRQHLTGQFNSVIAGDGREEDVVGSLPVHQLADALADQVIQGRRIGVETLSHNGHDVSPPLRAFAVRAIEEGVTGVYIDGS